MATAKAERPVLIQGCDAPISRIVGGGDAELRCAQCDNLLVEGFQAECMVGLGLECFKCRRVTRTESRKSGERFPLRTISAGSLGRFLMGRTLVQPRGVVLTCEQEIEAETAELGPAPLDLTPLHLSVEGLEALSVEFDLLSGGVFSARLRSVQRAFSAGNHRFLENELAWSVELLKRRFADDVVNLSDTDAMIASTFVISARHLLSIWRRHPTIGKRASELCGNEFRHTWAMLIAVSYLEQFGNRFFFNETGSKQSADLYLRVTAIENLYLEVKAPASLAWPKLAGKKSKLKDVVLGSLKTARGQISKAHPGLLILGASCVEPRGFFDDLKLAMRTVLRTAGMKYSGVAAIVLVAINSVSYRPSTPSSLSFSGAFQIDVAKNPHYYTDNPVQTGTHLAAR